MLCGIGGRTIEEAQRNLTFNEFNRWVRYRAKRGSLHLGRRIERGAALLAALYAQVHSKAGTQISIYDYMPNEEEPAESLEDAMKRWE